MHIEPPPSDSAVDFEATEQGAILSWDDKAPKDGPTFVMLGVLLAVWLGGLLVPTLALSVTGPGAILWLIAWGGVGLMVLYQMVRRVMVGKHQRMVLKRDQILFQPKVGASKRGRSGPMTKKIHHRHTTRGNRVPLRIEDLIPGELEAVDEPAGRQGLWLHTTPGKIRLGAALPPADQHYLHQALLTWQREAAPAEA